MDTVDVDDGDGCRRTDGSDTRIACGMAGAYYEPQIPQGGVLEKGALPRLPKDVRCILMQGICSSYLDSMEEQVAMARHHAFRTEHFATDAVTAAKRRGVGHAR